MAEWSKAPHSKCGVRETVPWVQIPLSPLYSQAQYYILFLMKPFHFAIIGIAFLLLAVVAYVVYEYAEAPQPSSSGEMTNTEVPQIPERALPVVEAQKGSTPLTYSEMVDAYVNEIASLKTLTTATTTRDFGYATIDKTIYTDAKGAVVRYVTEGGTDHRYVKQDYYYRDGALLFAFVTSGGVMGDMQSSAEYKIYFGKDGARVLETYLPSGSTEYAQPKTWTEVVLDPKADFLKGTAD